MKNLFRVRIFVDDKLLSLAYFSDWDDAKDYAVPFLCPDPLVHACYSVSVDYVEVDVHVL